MVKQLKHRKQSVPRSAGFTLVELMMGVLIMTIAFATMATVFTSISTSILVNKTKTIATNLCQEKVESLKNLSYYKLLVSTSISSDSNFPGMNYDQGTTLSYYPEETLYVGGLKFIRRVLVDFVKEDGGAFVSQPWTANDTGIKRVTVYVVWQESNVWKKAELRNLRNNPNRAELEYTFTGTVSSGSTGNGIYNAIVETLQNPSYFGRTDASGNYSFKVQPGTYTLRATATGYFQSVGSGTYVIASGQTGSNSKNFQMSLMAVGQTTGAAFIRNHLVITQVVAEHDNGGQTGQEWVELYNPTTYNILIASRSVAGGAFDIFFVTVTWFDTNNNDPPNNGSRYLLGMPGISGSEFTAFRGTSTRWSINTPTISVPAQSFFLISNFSTVAYNGFLRIADAYYDGGNGGSNIDNVGGIRVTGRMGYAFNGRTDWHDGVAWGNNSGLTKAIEGTVNQNNLSTDNILFRLAYKLNASHCSDAETAVGRTENPWVANAFDRNTNGSNCNGGSDWDWNTSLTFYLTQSTALANADITMAPLSGTPAAGAAVTANDELSMISYVQTYGSYTLTNISTGVWTVTVSSGYFTVDIESVTMTPSLSTSIAHMSTNPKLTFPTIAYPAVALSSSSIYGYVSGTVRDITGAGMSGVTISASGANNVTTNSQGRYRLSVIPSGVPISVNATKSGNSTEIVQDIGVTLGVDVSTVNFTLVSAGSLRGFVTTNGVASGALPGVPVVAYDLSSTTVMGSAITGVDGIFTIPSIATGAYIVEPQIETGESCSPTNITRTVTTASTGTWTSTFTISNAFGQIAGVVGSGSASNPITSGVLIVACTTTITTDSPPAMDAATRSGGVVYYAVSSDASGNYTLPLRGNASYYIYGWYPNSLDVSGSTAPKRQVTSPASTHYVTPGGSITRNVLW